MKKTVIFVTLLACVGFGACTINIGDRNSGNDKKKETKTQKKVLIDINSNQQSTSGPTARVYVDAIGIYYTAIDKGKPQMIDQEELKNYLRSHQETDSCFRVVLCPDEYAEYGKVRYVMRIAQELNMNLAFEDDRTKNEPKAEPGSMPKTLPSPPTPPIKQPDEPKSEEPIVSEDEILALRAKQVEDSIREVLAKQAAESIAGLFWGPSDPSDEGTRAPGNMARGQGYSNQNYDLEGRRVIGNLPQPTNDFNQEGTVIVQIRVDAKGNVIEAFHRGGNIADRQTIQLALNAANKAKFTEGKQDQIGTITYLFKLK